MNRELREAEAAKDWLAAGLMLVRLQSPATDALRQATPWLRAAAAEAAALPPPGFIADVGRLLSHPGVRLLPSPRGPLGRTLRSYEDQVLGRLAVDPHREAAFDAVSALPERLRPAAIALFVEQVLDRVGYDSRVALDPGALRALDRATGEEWLIRGAAALRSEGVRLLAESYDALVACFQRTGRPIEPGDIVILEQLELLELRSDRMALRQVVDAAASLGRGLPKKRKATRRRAGHISTQLEDTSAYPVGGFSSISTRGSIENLVTSELALMEDGPEIDLFDVRYMEGELLYYTRDESAFVRERRHITLVLDGSLEDARFRDDGLPFQRLVLALALVRALIEQLAQWLDRQDLTVVILLPTGRLREAVPVLRLALADWTEAGLVQWDEGSGTTERFEALAKTVPTDVVWIGSDRDPTPIPHVWQSRFEVAGVPRVKGAFGALADLPSDPWEAWRAALSALLSDLV